MVLKERFLMTYSELVLFGISRLWTVVDLLSDEEDVNSLTHVTNVFSSF